MVLKKGRLIMDNLQIYLNKDEIIEIKGSMDLSEGEFIQARLISGNLMLKVVNDPEFFNPKFMYFRSLDDLSFKRLMINYLFFKEVPGVILMNSDGTFIDIELDKEALKNEIEDLGELGAAKNCNKYMEIGSITDLLYVSNDYNPDKEILTSPEFKAAFDKLNETVEKINVALGKKIVYELNYNICQVIKLMNVDQFKLGYNIALEHLADLIGYPGNSIEERVKAELEE